MCLTRLFHLQCLMNVCCSLSPSEKVWFYMQWFPPANQPALPVCIIRDMLCEAGTGKSWKSRQKATHNGCCDSLVTLCNRVSCYLKGTFTLLQRSAATWKNHTRLRSPGFHVCGGSGGVVSISDCRTPRPRSTSGPIRRSGPTRRPRRLKQSQSTNPASTAPTSRRS